MQNIKGESILKGNAKFLNRLIVWVMSILISASVLFVGMTLNKTKYVNAAVTSGDNYSQKDEDDIILSVEKVGILSTGDDYLKDYSGNDLTTSDSILSYFNSSNYAFKNVLYSSSSNKTSTLNKLYVDNTKDTAYPKQDENADQYPSYYYKDIQNGTNTKTVYHSGDYIMLENNLKTKNGYTYYYNPAIRAFDDNGEVDMAEGVLFSFGSYRLGTNSVGSTTLIRNSGEENSTFTYAKNVQQINVSATLNGSSITLPVVRQYDDANYQDFTFIIPQRKGFDGHYEFEVEYRHNEVFKRQTFSFDLVFKSTYTEPESFAGGSGYSYDTMPKINVPVGSANEYYLGSNTQYPTLTYDFSKYTLDYTLSANGLTTSYSYRRVLNSNNGYDLVGTISSSNGTYTTTEHLNGENKAVFVFTEVGHYQFEYEYIYNGVQNDMGFTINGDSLDIYGYELKYSKAGYSEAQMRYLKIRKHTKDMVVLIVPNGYLKENEPDDLSSLGVAYSIEEVVSGVGQDYRTGYIAENNDALIEFSVKDAPIIDFENVTYQTTNQGGIWFSSNRNYIASTETAWNSYYYYSTTKITTAPADSERRPFNNTTTFNQVGYYLVVINVNMNDAEKNFYEVFAFRYTNSTSNVEVNALTVNENGEPVDQNGNVTTDRSQYQYKTPIGSGKFTNQAVKISWEKPGVFERKMTVKYYSNLNVYLTRDESKSNGTSILTSNELLKQAVAKEVENGAILGENITAGNGSSFLIEATNEGQAKAYRSFTVDKTNIAGVSVYQVEQIISNGNTLYTIKVDNSGNYVKFENAITNKNSAIYWRDKVSGAEISATYYYAPFVKGNDTIQAVYNTSSQIWYPNQYTLGNQTGPFKIEKPEQLSNSIASSNVLKNDGVYLFVLTDEAGNSCRYMFIIDDTEQYFKIGDNFYTQENLVFATATTVEFATHKAIKIAPTTSEATNEINTLISAFVNNSSDLGNYYTGELDNDSNISKLQALFNSNTNGDKYLTVKNTKIELLNQYNDSFDPIKVEKSSTENPNYEVNPENKIGLETDANEYVRRLYIFGENQANVTQKDGSKSYIRVEINDDHSLGKVYYSNDQSSLSDEDSLVEKGYMLSTGATISAAMATCDDLVAFYWTQGVGEYKIDKITYLYYPMTEGYNSATYFYNGTPSEVELYVDGNTTQPVAGNKTDRYYKEINVQSGKTQEGLYIVKRYYEGNKNPQLYYFIVDRSEINKNNQISLKLLEENDYKDFSKYGTKAESFYDPDDSTNLINYQVSLKTNKVPVKLQVPVAKFFDGTNKSSYYAGRLNLTLYYKDTQNQIDGKVHKLFSTKDYADGLSDKEKYYTDSDYLFINLKEAIKSSDVLYPMIENISGSDWIWLAGDYVFVVEDNVLSSSLTNRKKTFAFSIDKQNPSTNVFATVEETGNYENSAARAEYNETENRFDLSTNAEFVKLELKQYDKNQSSAQIDPNYLVITRNMDGVSETYFNFQHRNLGGLKNLADIQFDTDTNIRTIVLETGLNRKNGAIDMASSAKHVEYTIKIRFKLTEKIDSTNYEPIYANCYRIKENGRWVSYYEMTYLVVIDRMPPTTNASALEQSDTLAEKYNQENGIDSMFEVAAYENGGQYFVNRYASYYNNKKPGNIYAFEVANTTTFSTQDVNRLYYRQIPSIKDASLNMPISNFATYTMISSVELTSKSTYGGVFPSEIDVNEYYEIVEVDAAGNMSQYVILYRGNTTSDDVNNVTFTFNATYVDEAAITTGEVTISNNNKEITLFSLSDLKTDGGATTPTDRFFNIEILKNGTVVKIINTNFETNFTNTGLSATICDVINTNGLGNYTINVNSRHSTLTYIIRYYDQNTRVELDAKDLVKRDSQGNFRIELSAANVSQDGILYYATQIEVTGKIDGTDTTNTYTYDNGKYRLNGEEVSSITNLEGTYQIKLTDAFGSTSTYRFDTEQGDMFHSIAFEGETSTNPKYYKSGNNYYGFTKATIKFNSSLYKQITLSYSINGVQHQYTVTIVDDVVTISPADYLVSGDKIQYEYLLDVKVDMIKINKANNTIELLPFTATSTGAIVDYDVALWYGGSIEYTYNVVLDSYTKKVSLKNTENLEHEMDFEYNQDYDKVVYKSTTSGVMNLMWDKVENDYFTYSYKLYEKLADDTIATYDLDDYTSRVINTTSESKGVYWFEITIFTKDGYRLGNKVYAFSVVATLTDLYYVQTEDMVAISANSSFKLSELPTDFNYSSLKLDNEEEIVKPIINLPLYISNKALTVVLAEDQGAQKKSTNVLSLLDGKAEFVLHRVYTNTYSRYFATLVVKPNSNDQIARNVEIKNGTDGSLVQDYIKSYYVKDKFTLNFTQTSADVSNITSKNYIILNVYHNNVLLEKVSYPNTLSIEYEIKGSGEYKFEICDLAGNKHVFKFNDQTGTEITINVMKNIYFTMNGNAPIDNAVFNDAVELNVVNPYNYDSINTQPVSISATKNGSAYTPKQKGYAYTFDEFGSFEVTFSATYDGNELTSSISFVIMNKNEARLSYDLTPVMKYNVIKVENQSGVDITEAFKKVITQNGKLLSYDVLMENSDNLGISAGKQSLKLTYEVVDGIYPARQATFVFTLNDEVPTIECSLELGKETNKGFDITFNPGIIYEQVGDSYIYINDTLIYEINETSVLEMVTHSITQKENGSGDYYVKLIGSSGNVITSFKVVVKEPLNIWAIIIIVVVSVIVIGVTLTIVILRNKMRIR